MIASILLPEVVALFWQGRLTVLSIVLLGCAFVALLCWRLERADRRLVRSGNCKE